MSIWGWTHEPELLWLGEQAAKMDSVVEIGSLHGRSAFALLSACPGSVYCVDSWSDIKDQSYGSFMSHCGHFPNLVPVRAFSPSPAIDLVQGMVDMTFIDGSHVYSSVLADIAGWLPKTRKLICGHDFHEGEGAGFPDVAVAVKEVFGDRWTVAPETSIWAVDLEADRSVAPHLLDTVLDYIDEYDRHTRVAVTW